MKRIIFLIFLCSGISLSIWASAPDYRPEFDKAAYKGTIWTQVNPWWIPTKQRVDDSGGPNYARKKHDLSCPWGSAMADSYHYGHLNWQVELHVQAPGYARTMKRMMREAKEKGIDAKFSIFLVYYGKKGTLEDQVRKTISQLDMLKEELKSDPAIFRIEGAPVISIYSTGFFSPEEWGKVIPEVEKKCGKFIWLMNTCRGPAPDSDSAKGKDWVGKYLPYFDGVTQYGNYSETSQAAHYAWLAKIMHEKYPKKIFEASVQNAYVNHFHFGGSAPKLSEKWRKSFETTLNAKPDSIVYTNYFDHYENSLVLPDYEREDFLLRYGEYWVCKWRNEPFLKEKFPELVLTNYTTIMLGQQNLDFEVIGFPIDSKYKLVNIKLDICDTSGKVLYSFPSSRLDLSGLCVKEFSVPSERFSKLRGIVPRLRYTWHEKEYKMNYNPMTLISPSIRSNLMFWARSSKNVLICNVINPDWFINETSQGGTLMYPEDGIAEITAFVKSVYGKQEKRNGSSFFRLMRNGLEFYTHQEKKGGMFLTRAISLPSPADALNYYHLELENTNGYRYQTLPIWITNNRRSGKVKVPIQCGNKVREFEIEAVRVPYFYYPCIRNTGVLLLDYSGYFHNGLLNGKGYGGGHLGYTGYYHYHNGSVMPVRENFFMYDKNGKGMLRFTGKEYLMIMGGTAFPGASTYEVSIRPAKIGKKMGIIGTANNQISLSLEADGRVKLIRSSEKEGEGGNKPRKKFDSIIYSMLKLDPGKWYRIAVVYDLKLLKLYINGELQGQQETPFKAYHAWINHLTVGSLCKWIWTPEHKFIGDIREIRFYGRNLSPDEFLK